MDNSKIKSKQVARKILLFMSVTLFFLMIIMPRTVFSKEAATQEGVSKDKVVQDKMGNKDKVSSISPLIKIKRLETKEPRYSIELKGVDLADIFRVFAHDYNLNIITGPSIHGKITASFTNVSFEEALKGIAEVSNIAFRKEGNIMIVGVNFVSRVFKLKYLDVKQIAGELSGEKTGITESSSSSQQSSSSGGASSGGDEKGQYSKVASSILGILSSKGKVLFGSEPNSILVIDYPDNIKKVSNYLKMVDVAPRQVLIEARFVEVDLGAENALGVNWDLFAKKGGLKVGQLMINSYGGGTSGALSQSIPFKNTVWPPDTTTGTAENPFTVAIFDDNINVVLQALANSLKTHILSAPRVTTVNNRPAEIKIVQNLPWAEPQVDVLDNGGVAITWTVNFEEVGIKLKVTPVINSDDKVTMVLEPEVSEKTGDFELTVVQGTTQIPYTVPIIDKRTASTKVIIGNGQTLIIGGLIKDKLINQVTKVPLLGDVPIIGNLFKSKKDIKDKSELLIFVSPTIVGENNLARMKNEEKRLGSWYKNESYGKRLAELPPQELNNFKKKFNTRYGHLENMYDSLKKERKELDTIIDEENNNLRNIESKIRL